MSRTPEEASPAFSKRFSNLRSIRWRIGLKILPDSPSSSVDDLRRIAADARRRYASLRRHVLTNRSLSKDGDESPDLVMDNPLSQNPESTWGRFFKNAELEKMLDQDLSRLYPEHGNYFQTSACQTMLRRILLIWCLQHPEFGYRQGMHELLAPLVYVLHVDLDHLSRVHDLYEDCFNDDFDGISFPQSDLVSNYQIGKSKGSDIGIGKENLYNRSTARSFDELDLDAKDIFLLSDPYGAEGELGVILSERFMEHDAYCMFDSLMNGAHGAVAMADLFSPLIGSNTSLLPVIEASSALYHLLSVVDSSLHAHLVELGVEPQYFALRWLRVLFGREFCLDDLLLVWDELFLCSNDVCVDKELEYNFKVLCSHRGAFIAALAVSILLHLRSSLLATENPTSCLQRLLNFPENPDMKKLISKAKSLQILAIDSNILSSSNYMFHNNKLTVDRGYSLPSSSPKIPVNPLRDSYWEEKWRDLHKSEELQKGSNDLTPRRTVKKFLGERFGLSRTESAPSPSTVNGGKDHYSSVRRRLLDDLSHDIKSAKNQIKSEPNVAPTISHKRSPLPLEVSIEKGYSVESVEENVTEMASGSVAEVACVSGESSIMFSTTMSPHSPHENNSEKSSVTSNSFIDADEEVCNLEESSSHSPDNQLAEKKSDGIPALNNVKDMNELDASSKEKKPNYGKFQWFWMFARSSGDGNLENGGSHDTEKPSATLNSNRGNMGSSNSRDAFNSYIRRKVDAGDKKVVNTWKNLGHSMIENIQVIETVFQQDWGQSSSLENLSNNILGGKGQATAMTALKELRKISNILNSERSAIY